MKTLILLVFTMFATLSFAQSGKMKIGYDSTFVLNNETGIYEYYADESYPPVRTDTIPALILYYTDYAPHIPNSNAGHTLIINDGYVIFDIYETGDGDLTYDINGNVSFNPIERREMIGVLFFDYTPFPDTFKFFDYRLKTEFE